MQRNKASIDCLLDKCDQKYLSIFKAVGGNSMKRLLLTLLVLITIVKTQHTSHFSRAKIAAGISTASIVAAGTSYVHPKKSKLRPDQIVIKSLDLNNQSHIDQIIALCKKHERMLFAPDMTTEDTMNLQLAFMKKKKKNKNLSFDIQVMTLTDNPGKIIGFAFLAINKNWATQKLKECLRVNKILSYLQVLQIAIDQDYQGQGLGTEMLNRFINQAHQKNLEAVLIEVYDENESMLRLMKKYKFQPIYKDLYPSEPFADGTRSFSTTYCLLF